MTIETPKAEQVIEIAESFEIGLSHGRSKILIEDGSRPAKVLLIQ